MKKEYNHKRIALETYCFSSEKITKRLRIHVISDFHGALDRAEISALTAHIEKRRPDVILIPGDCVTRRSRKSMTRSLILFKKLCGLAPVYYSPGNHETYMEQNDAEGNFHKFQKKAEKCGVKILKNRTEKAVICGNALTLYGLELEKKFYTKPFSASMPAGYLESLFGEPEGEAYHILLAHSPKYGREYLKWGADLTVCGHYHGGVIRFGRHWGLVSPQFHPFPKFCCGDFRKGASQMVVSAGLGEHSMPLRICNPRVLVEINVMPA
ncbi:MAG: metallophosphoesterase [Eubacteriales bacterium]|nr:metallophosphoesterase [Eubacteriales bacterium]